MPAKHAETREIKREQINSLKGDLSEFSFSKYNSPNNFMIFMPFMVESPDLKKEFHHEDHEGHEGGDDGGTDL